MTVPLPRALLASRATALQAMRGGRTARWLARAGPSDGGTISIVAVAAAPEWLCLKPGELDRLAQLMGSLCWAAGLVDSIDGRALDRLAQAVGQSDADWALESMSASDNGQPRIADLVSGWAEDVAWTGDMLADIGVRLQRVLLVSQPQHATLAPLLGGVNDDQRAPLPPQVARAVIVPALARLRTAGLQP